MPISRNTFPGGGSVATLRLVDSKTTPNGVMIATYHPRERAAAAAPAAERDHQTHSRW